MVANFFCWSCGNVEGACSKGCQQVLKRWRAHTNAGGKSHEPNSRFRIFANPFKSSSPSSSSTPLYCLRENISFDTLIRRSSRGHNSRKATQPSHCGTCLILLIFIAKRVQPSLPSSTLRSNFVYPRQISRSPRVGHCMS